MYTPNPQPIDLTNRTRVERARGALFFYIPILPKWTTIRPAAISCLLADGIGIIPYRRFDGLTTVRLFYPAN
ncbi:hypothetical protein A2480_01620 [Candidatus Uhrbacteria bacterium RIFOXYC2_FULL_47_19]|uniref:Uncharacterized protein n=1 Tax=Candidatus Uhrbacteria bacterium RIFOXYC2_FULL_47_19 TaxID=1802424 RepID=A0A1F7WGP3_9BACT|nr:MAG: hypothetical protein A2480_01620 [Candidatus Uhrbacteria bacterium RIFOXYC2_FULL_47_19]HCC21809.1 hypothetical protein [Candidatus Uhrbacteria bacterium]